ncbi:hypothetical protein CHARACLAT_015818 [Characodon lateralis]|uniref:Uncharacterized protein n=1 Tax=Characodon lateralis TaxID=208331 RepID=A0ABU7EA24_9TELE|nr:hypothetical protein [Characodon lateralis]
MTSARQPLLHWHCLQPLQSEFSPVVLDSNYKKAGNNHTRGSTCFLQSSKGLMLLRRVTKLTSLEAAVLGTQA